jgi:hypothetical protein
MTGMDAQGAASALAAAKLILPKADVLTALFMDAKLDVSKVPVE